MKGTKIEWTEDMEKYLRKYFPTKFNTDIAKHLGISLRSVIRKARELGIEKVEDFHQMNAEKIGRKISKVNKGMHNSGSFKKGSEIGKEYRFQKGHQLTEEQMNKKKENSSKNAKTSYQEKPAQETGELEKHMASRLLEIYLRNED